MNHRYRPRRGHAGGQPDSSAPRSVERQSLAGPVLAVRPDDLVSLQISFENIALDTTQRMPVLRRADADKDAFLVLELPAQAIAEEAFYFDKLEPTTPGSSPTWPPARTILSNPTRLVFRVPVEIAEIHYSLEGILAVLPNCPLIVARSARSDLPPTDVVRPTKPGSLETAIEAPYRLVLSPDQCAAWEHAAIPVTHGERTELWHTRLGFRRPQQVDEAPLMDMPCVPAAIPSIRVIWSRDCPEGNVNMRPPEMGCVPPVNDPGRQTRRPGDDRPMPSSLWPKARCELAWLTTSRNVLFTPDRRDYAAPLAARQVMLSSLGAFLNLYGEWIFPSPIARFEHRATLGREQLTRLELRGYFWPLGHRATLVLLTERRLRPDLDGAAPIAYLVQELYIETAEPIKVYPPEASPLLGRQLPFQRIRILTERTPRIPSGDLPTQNQTAFWIRVGGSDFMFAVEGVDGDGSTIRWTMPLAFVCQNFAVPDLEQVQTEFTGERRTRPLNGQRLAYVAEQRTGAREPSGKTSLNTQSFTFGTERPTSATGPAGPPFLPVMDAAEVQVPAIQYLTRSGLATQTIQYFEGYLRRGLDPQLGGIFAVFPTPPGLDMPPELGGGLANLRPRFEGLSRELGPIGQLPTLDPGTGLPVDAPDPIRMLRNSELLGGITLADIVELPAKWEGLAPSATNVPGLPKIPGLTVTYDDPRDPKVITATLTFKPPVRDHQFSFLQFFASARPPEARDPRPRSVLEISAETQIRRDGTPPTTLVRGTLTDFVVRIADVIDVSFERFAFVSRAGEKPDVNVGLRDVTFRGALAFVDQLAKLIEGKGFADPPTLEVTTEGLKLGYSLTLPPVEIGIFTMTNISLGASLYLPLFGGEPFSMGFHFARRERPFTVGVAPFSGGGFFGIVVGARGVDEIEAAIEFGGSLSLNLGVASGGVSVKAGIYFKLEKLPSGSTAAALTGYVRANGSLEVLGLVRVSVELYLGLTVQFKRDNQPIIIHGEARLVLEISIAFFTIPVTLSVERSFDGPDPGFAKSVPLSAWKRYALAFA
ncbi:hypothetical protein [Sorangium sp. So ce128]|uniref:hypothetical protein n=1 Tax=Sorangium sp. So ce128 TaxID=3133281 RepID=UPI003F622B80